MATAHMFMEDDMTLNPAGQIIKIRGLPIRAFRANAYGLPCVRGPDWVRSGMGDQAPSPTNKFCVCVCCVAFSV